MLKYNQTYFKFVWLFNNVTHEKFNQWQPKARSDRIFESSKGGHNTFNISLTVEASFLIAAN